MCLTTLFRPGATASVIENNFVVLWNEPGNIVYSVVRGTRYKIFRPKVSPQAGLVVSSDGIAGSPFDFWITSNTTDMAMDLIPISDKTLLFGHTRIINRPITQLCYQTVIWDGTNIPQSVSSDKMMCVEGAFGSPETSAVTWDDGQV